jgi:hypothetical protein
MNCEVIVVSGLPRSGTSLMMQLLDAGGIEVVTDCIRTADTDNPRGYYECERVKKIKHDASWLPGTRAKAVKMVSQLLYDLPATEQYRIIFMERDMAEVLDSQEKMLHRLGRPGVPRPEIMRSFEIHLARLERWLLKQPNMAILRVRYADVVAQPEVEAKRLNEFLGGRLEVPKAIRAIDPSLYRNRKAAIAAAG